MKQFLIFMAFLLTSCGPLAIDFTVGWGSNQSIKKTLDMDQKQTKAQTEASVDVVENIISVIPFLKAEPTPTPTPLPKIKSITIELEPRELPEIPVYTKQPYNSPVVECPPCPSLKPKVKKKTACVC